MKELAQIRSDMRQFVHAPDQEVIRMLRQNSIVNDSHHQSAVRLSSQWVEFARTSSRSNLMDIFMAEYGLSTDEGIALMCLAEALLRVPDSETIDALIEDKIAPSNWSAHLGHSASPLVNASTWALMLTGRVLDESSSMAGVLHGAIKRLGEPAIRRTVRRAMRELGKQFVLGRNITEAIRKGKAARELGYTFSYDMLGEAAWTAADAAVYFDAYFDASTKLAEHCFSSDIHDNPGISIKLSALFERYEEAQREKALKVLIPRVLELALVARQAGMGLNVDAEEASRLELYMDVVEVVLRHPGLADWDGFGIVVQAYGKRARFVIDWYYALARTLNRKVSLRLVKGAYWDTEIKIAQVDGVPGFPVFETKAATDISYIENASHLLKLTDRIYPQFATHNAHTIAIIHSLAKNFKDYEFQRLHGMGDALYAKVLEDFNIRCRIYAPVGVHKDLLAYLVRRLLENGANSSFVHQILDPDIPVMTVVADPYTVFKNAHSPVNMPRDIFGRRKNSRGWDLNNRIDLANLEAARSGFADRTYHAGPITITAAESSETVDVINPATLEKVGAVSYASADTVNQAVKDARTWDADRITRASVLCRAADLYEANYGEIFALLSREAGKTQRDVIAELREAVDFLRFYADEALKHDAEPVGIFACISPWNFPLAIFTGQISAALAAGNAVLAKPAEATSLIAHRAVSWLHEAGVPKSALQLLPGRGTDVGQALTSHHAIGGVCFTGSTATAQHIHRNMADHLAVNVPLIAETGGLNAMIVDSTALPEQAVRDIVISAFQSAGQRCSALRVLYLQEDVADPLLEMLFGAIDAQSIGNPWLFSTDIGPVIDDAAATAIRDHISTAAQEGRVLKSTNVPRSGNFVPPTVIALDGIYDLDREIFGPVLHLVRYKAHELSDVINDINTTGYGLTFGIHSRIHDRVELATNKVGAGNIYVNRNQIGAIVGSQPFGGKGLSGTGPKAGGPLYLHRFYRDAVFTEFPQELRLPGPTGESNQWSRHPRGVILCAGPSCEDAQTQALIAKKEGCETLVRPAISAEELIEIEGINGVIYWGMDGRQFRQALAQREGAILPLITSRQFAPYCWVERHLCIDTTAAGGNTELLTAVTT